MDKNTILVVMPVYNAEKTLSQAVESILSQVYSNLHLVIVDDCSSDNSLAIAKQYLSDPRVSVYHNKKNMGAYYGRNFGLYIMRNEQWGYFTTHDSDDISHKTRYNKLIKVISTNASSNGIQDAFARRDIETNRIIEKSLTIAHAVFKRSVFDAIGYFDGVRFGGDWEHWQRLKHYNAKNKMGTRALRSVQGDSFVHDQNLTVLIPLTSPKRKKYIEQTYKKLVKMDKANNYYYGFVRPAGVTVKVRK